MRHPAGPIRPPRWPGPPPLAHPRSPGRWASRHRRPSESHPARRSRWPRRWTASRPVSVRSPAQPPRDPTTRGGGTRGDAGWRSSVFPSSRVPTPAAVVRTVHILPRWTGRFRAIGSTGSNRDPGTPESVGTMPAMPTLPGLPDSVETVLRIGLVALVALLAFIGIRWAIQIAVRHLLERRSAEGGGENDTPVELERRINTVGRLLVRVAGAI